MGGRLLRITNGHDSEPLDPMSLSGERKSKVWSVVRVSSGNFLEMYDFMVFGYYATAIGNAFFPSGNPFLSLMLSLMTFGAGFLMRPLGAIVLGAYTDHHGRRAGLILTLTLMSVGIFSIACTPRYATIGLLAPLLVLIGPAAGVFGGHGTGRRVRLFIRNCYTETQRLLRELAIGQPAGSGHVRCSRWSRPQLHPSSGKNDGMGMARPPASRLRDNSLSVSAQALSPGDGRVRRAQAPAHNIRDFPFPYCQLGDRAGRDDDGHNDHGFLLYDHGLHSHLRQLGAPSGDHRQFSCDSLRRGVKPILASVHGGAVRPDRSSPFASGFHHPHAGYLLSCDAVAGARTFVHAAADGGTLAVLYLRQLQRRDGRVPDGDHASRRANFRVFTCLQFGHRRFRWLYARNQHLLDSSHWESCRSGVVVVLRSGVRASGSTLG